MAIEQRINYTVLPTGTGDSGPSFSVLVSPRLKKTNQAGRPMSGKLGNFAGWVDWPATVRGLNWTLNVNGKKVTPRIISGAPSSQHWAALFNANTDVQPFVYKELEAIFSYPTDHVLEYMSNKYADLAQVVDPPEAAQLLASYAEINVLSEKSDTLAVGKQIDSLLTKLGKKSAIPRSSKAKPTQDFTQAALFHAPTLNPATAAANRAARGGDPKLKLQLGDFFRVSRPAAPEPPDFDFHQAVALLGSHPQLLRLLGLVIDFEFTSPFGGQTLDTSAYMTVTSTVPQGKIRGPQVETSVTLTPERLVATSVASVSEVRDGMLNLATSLPDGTPEYSLVDVDVDGAALKTVNFVNELARAAQEENDTGESSSAEQLPPSFRSAGLSIVRKNRADTLANSLRRQAVLNRTFATGEASDGDSVTLFAEDLTKGYAFDIFDVDSSTWYPLCARQGEARFGPDPSAPTLTPVPLAPEDGWVGTAITQGLTVGDTTAKVSESIGRWSNGWSMVTKRPGKTIDPSEQPADYQPQLTNVPLSVTYETVPNTLPLQRFGRAYRVRARAVDLAGNRISFEEAEGFGTDYSLGTPGYKRADPISPPTVLNRAPVTEGESAHRIVIRSKDKDTAVGTPVPSERHLFPPSLDQFRAECHGVWDSGDAKLNPVASYQQIRARESVTYAGPDAFGNPHAGTQPDPKNHGAPYNSLAEPVYRVEDNQLAPMPNLPDPISSGASFKGLPGVPASQLRTESFYRNGAEWPTVSPIRLHVFESESFVAPQLVGRELRVGLPKGETFDVKMSSYLSDEDIEVFKPWEFLQTAGRATTALKAQIALGEHWAFTPPRQLKLVHAVRKPLKPTLFTGALTLSREKDQTFVTLTDTMSTDRKSSEKVDVTGSWTEISDYVDSRTGTWEPERSVPASGHAFEAKIDFNRAKNGELPISSRHALRHTRHIPEMSYDTEATTRYREYFAERQTVTFTQYSQTAVLTSDYTGAAAGDPGVVPDSETVTSGGTTYRRGFHYSIDYTTGIIRRLPNGLPPMSSTVKVSFLVPPISTPSPAPKVVRVLSSARPAAPKPLYAVPTFKWERVEGLSEKRSKRGGGGLRVYLDRPWWSSGANEQLAVVAFDVSAGAPKDVAPALEPYLTQRGQDPLWGGARTGQFPRPKDFTNAESTRGFLTIPELPGARVGIAAFDVHPLEVEEGRGPDSSAPRWYCDIDLAAGSAYTPFVRLALARYQPYSISGVELSQVVLLDFMQLMSDRVATVTRSGGQLSLSVSGRSYRSGSGSVPANAYMEAVVEKRRSGMEAGDDAVGWEPVGDPLELSSSTGITGVTTWTRTLTAPGSGRHRIAIREYEQFMPSSGTELDRRLVYADAIPL